MKTISERLENLSKKQLQIVIYQLLDCEGTLKTKNAESAENAIEIAEKWKEHK